MGLGAAEALFPRGSTFYNGGTIDSNNLLGGNILGQLRMFPDKNPSPTSTSPNSSTSNLQVTCIALRNKIGSALLPGQAVLFSTTTTGETGATITQTGTPNVLFGIVDEYLPAAGVPSNDIFWCVIKGPTTALMTTVSGAKAAGQLAVQPSASDNGKLDFTTTTYSTATIAANAAIYGNNAFTEGALADQATSARVILNKGFHGA